MNYPIQIINFLTATVALITAAVGLRKAIVTAATVKNQSDELEKLRALTSVVNVALTIESPREREVITAGIYNDMKGEYVGNIPPDYSLWVVARDAFSYFLMFPQTQYVTAMGRWSQTNIRLATDGEWQLHVVLANQAASRWFQQRADANDWRGFTQFPTGAATIRFVTVTKRG